MSRFGLFFLTGFLAVWLLPLSDIMAGAGTSCCFEIRVIDRVTGRGVPMVELRTPNDIRYYTDSAGCVAIRDPDLMGQRIFFKVESPGYKMPKQGWFRGFRVRPQPRGSKTVEIERTQIAERLYRVTGHGIYRHTVILGKEAPIKHPLLNAKVAGQDSVHTVIYRNKLYWFWGDTTRLSFPLGNFETTGAVSELPSQGGLEPSVGVNLNYFENESGFVRKMCPIEGKGPVWTRGHTVLRHKGTPKLVCHYARVKNLGKRLEHGMAVWNDDKQRFEKQTQFPLDAPLHPHGNPTRVTLDDQEWFYYTKKGYPVVRVRAEWNDLFDPTKYEAFTCLKPGARWASSEPPIERDEHGAPVWGWKADTAPVHGPAKDLADGLEGDVSETPKQKLFQMVKDYGNRERYLRSKNRLDANEGITYLRDVVTGRAIVVMHRSSLYWNAYRSKWIMLFQGGTQPGMGKVWYAEADTLLGPWVYACRVAEHDGYSFYNVKQHPYFAEEDGRIIYFEGTYSKLFTDKQPTPRYNYNQIMYRLDLSDSRLTLPAPVYETKRDHCRHYATGNAFPDNPPDSVRVPFYAIPPDRAMDGTLPVCRVPTGQQGQLAVKTDSKAASEQVVFRALPVNAPPKKEKSTKELFEYRHRETGDRIYRTANHPPSGNYERGSEPLCRVWTSPRLDPPMSQASNGPAHLRAEP